MIDEATAERLSRYLDGDLTAVEATELEGLLRADVEVAAELEALRRLQLVVRLAADHMDPPEALDTLLEPLRTGEPHAPRRHHPAIRWVGVAAGVALAVTVAMEVARENSAPSIPSLPSVSSPAPAADNSEIFQLKPLPTSPVPPEEERLSASDRLLASPPTEMELDEPEALDVRGPLPSPPDKKEKARRIQGSESGRMEGEKRGREVGERVGSGVAAAPGVPSSAMRDTTAEEKTLSRRTAPAPAVVLEAVDGSAVAVIDLALDPSILPAEVTIVAGVIEQVHSVASDADVATAAGLLVGHWIPGVADGRYRVVAGDENATGSVVVQ